MPHFDPIRWLLRVAFALAVFLAASHAASQPAAPERGSAFHIQGLDDRPALREELHLMALRARYRIQQNTDLDWQGAALIVWTDEQDFLARTGFRPEHVAAAASPERRTIWINEAAWTKSPRAEQLDTLTHELGHVLLGSLPGGTDLPLWVNEGIVMHLANQWTWDRHLNVLNAHFMGRLPRLAELERRFPRDEAGQRLAYDMSYAATEAVAQAMGDEPGEVRRLIARLSHPENGPRLMEDFWDDFLREGWQLAAQRSMGSRAISGAVLVTGSGFIFLLAAVLVIIAFFKLRSRNAELHQMEDEEEPWRASLTEADIQDIYGDKEDRWKQ